MQDGVLAELSDPPDRKAKSSRMEPVVRRHAALGGPGLYFANLSGLRCGGRRGSLFSRVAGSWAVSKDAAQSKRLKSGRCWQEGILVLQGEEDVKIEK